jgi:hypothetical protein
MATMDIAEVKQMETSDLRDFALVSTACRERRTQGSEYMIGDSMEQYSLRRARVTVSGRREPAYLADEI